MKTLTSEEVEQMHLLLKQYHPYVVERHGESCRSDIEVCPIRHFSAKDTYILVLVDQN